MFGLDTTDYVWITLIPFVCVPFLGAFAVEGIGTYSSGEEG